MLPAAGDGDWVTPHRTRLEEARITLLEIQFAARLRLGEVGDLIGELEAAVATHPFQESLWELLITAQYRAGRQADALASYHQIRTQLADELGLDPAPAAAGARATDPGPGRRARHPGSPAGPGPLASP